MLIDAHVHMWHRNMLPDKAVANYMEPLLEFIGKYGELFNLDLDKELPFPDYDVPIDMPIESMDKNNMDAMVVLATDFELIGGNAMSNEEYHDWLFQRCSVDNRFIPFISVDPNRNNACEMIEKFVKKYSPRGIKMYPAVGFYPNDEKMKKYWDMVDDLGLLVVTHAGMALEPLDEKYCHPSYMKDVADAHPDMDIIIAHLGGKFYDELLPLMESCDNIYTDCSALQGWIPEDISMIHKRLDAVTSVFPDRVVFGTDFPLYDERVSASMFINRIREGKWGSDSIKEKLLGTNMHNLLLRH